MRKNILLFTFLALSLGLIAQKGSNDRQFKGEIIHLDGSTVQGYVELNGNDKAPWDRQSDVKFFTEGALADGKIKNNEKTKYSPKIFKDISLKMVENGFQLK